MAQVEVLVLPTRVGSDADRNHYFCCDEDVAMCGVDLSGVPFTDDEVDCRPCRYVFLEGLPCPVPGCPGE